MCTLVVRPVSCTGESDEDLSSRCLHTILKDLALSDLYETQYETALLKEAHTRDKVKCPCVK